MPSENSGMYNLSMLITVLFGVLSVIVLSLILGKEEGHDSKSTSIIAMTVAVFAATISLVGFGVSIHKAFTQGHLNLKTNIVIAILSAFMAVLLCCFATDMNLKWHADPDMQYVSIIIVVFLSLFTAALLAAFVRVCYQAYQTQQKSPTHPDAADADDPQQKSPMHDDVEKFDAPTHPVPDAVTPDWFHQKQQQQLSPSELPWPPSSSPWPPSSSPEQLIELGKVSKREEMNRRKTI